MGSNSQPPDHESDALTTVPRCPAEKKKERIRKVKIDIKEELNWRKKEISRTRGKRGRWLRDEA